VKSLTVFLTVVFGHLRKLKQNIVRQIALVTVFL
jgi:hypothetical protein